MTDLDRIHVIEKAALSGKQYVSSLIAQAQRCGLLTDRDGERIQLESLSLLAQQTEKCNRGKSSSIRVEKAQELLESIYYTVGVALKSNPSPENAIDALKTEPLSALFQDGQKQITRKIRTSRLMYWNIQKELFDTRNVFYRSTVVDGIGGFFKLYRPDCSAQDIHITADYPTFLGVTDLAGIEFIEQYLRNIAHENRFCRYFSADQVHHLLCGLDENYQQILMNLYEPALAAALGCVLTERPIRELSCDRDALKELFAGKTREEIAERLADALDQLVVSLDCPPGLSQYLRDSLPKLSGLLHHAMQLGRLEDVVLVPVWPEDQPQIILSYGERMENRKYTQVLDELMWCGSAEQKAELIRNKIHSLGDLLEILRDSEPTQMELVQMLGYFPPEIIAVLMRHYPNGDFLSDEREINVYSALQEFQSKLPDAARQQLEKAAQALRFDPKENAGW